MKARHFLAIVLMLTPALVQAGDPPSARAKAERSRTIEKRAARHATSRNAVARRNTAIAIVQQERAAIAVAVVAEYQARAERQRLYDAAVRAGMARAYGTNPFLDGGGGFGPMTSGLGVFNPAGSAVFLDVPGTNGASRVGVATFGRDVSLFPAPRSVNPVGINK